MVTPLGCIHYADSEKRFATNHILQMENVLKQVSIGQIQVGPALFHYVCFCLGNLFTTE